MKTVEGKELLSGVAKRLATSSVWGLMGWWGKGIRMREGMTVLECPPWTQMLGGGAVNQVKTPLPLTAESTATTVSDNMSVCG